MKRSELNRKAWSIAREIAGGTKGSKKYFGLGLSIASGKLALHTLDAKDISEGKAKVELVDVAKAQQAHNYSIDIPERVERAKARYQQGLAMNLPRMSGEYFEDGRHRTEAWRQLGNTKIWMVVE